MTQIRSPFVRAVALVSAVVVTSALAACAGPASTPPGSAPSSESFKLQTVTPGKLTIATGEPAFSPWVNDDKPESGEGFEAAVAYAVAEELGFDKDDVVWTRTTFDSAIAPGPKDFDFNLQQFSITEERKKAVDFSAPYYTTTQAIVTTADSDAAKITTIDGLKDVTIGVAQGTTTYNLLTEEVGGDAIQVFNSNADAVVALKSGQIDAIATDLPTAFYLSAVEVENGVVSGQFSNSEGGDQLGLVLPKDSPNTAAVTEAVEAITESGELAEITEKWLSSTVDVPFFE